MARCIRGKSSRRTRRSALHRKPLPVLPGRAVLDLAEGLCKIAQVGKAALGPDLAGAQAGGQQQPGGFFNAVLFHILDGRGTQQLPEAA